MVDTRVLQAKEIADTEPDEAMRLCNEVLTDNPDDPIALFICGYVMMQADRTGLAYNTFARCAELEPGKAEIYNNLGMCIDDADPERAIVHFKKALSIKPKHQLSRVNLAVCYLKTARFDTCISLCNEALKADPDMVAARYNRGLARLGNREWAKGWRDFSSGLGEKNRKQRDYGVPEWDGRAKGTVVIYGEQGVGDEIMFSSCVPDVQKTNKVILDVEPRLVSLFKRSFDCPVYGTRYLDETPLVDECEFDYQISMGELPRFYRNKGSDFPGTAYLKPDPERVIQWSALLDSLPGDKIGVSWSGGVRRTNKKLRSFSPYDFDSLFDQSLVSLGYNGAPPEDTPIHYWPRAVDKGIDFDETAALISQLDYVVTCCQSAVYVAGALGVPCYVLVPSIPMYRYHLSGDFPWYKSVKCIRQRDGEPWEQVVARAKREIYARKAA